MKSQKTEVAFIIDRSGSMRGKEEEVVSGFNKFIEDQKKLDGECFVSFFQFDNYFETVYENKNIKGVSLMTQRDFSPRGTTALYDAIGKVINRMGERYRRMEKEDRPDNVILGVITDGLENASLEFSKDQVKDMISHQETKYSWNILFLSESLDATYESKQYFRSANTMNTKSIGEALGRMSAYTMYSRSVDSNATLEDVEDDRTNNHS